jgi:hypothetical protein
MLPDDRDQLEALADRALRRLPPPLAPRTLLPRVLEAADAWEHRPWFSRAWFTWPIAWQALSVAVVVAFFYGAFHLMRAVPAMPASAVATADASRAVWDLVVAPLVPYLAVIFVVMLAACAAFGFALNYVLLERYEQ